MFKTTTTTGQFIVDMGCSVYCRTCAVPLRDLTDGKIDIFANTKIIALLSTIKEWRLEIAQDDGLSQCICRTCELALMKIDTFRLQALKAREYLQTRLQLLETATGGDEKISDNENDLQIETNCGAVEMQNREALPRTMQFDYTSIQNCKNAISIYKANEKVRENEQKNNFESGLSAVIEETGELSFDSNIESSRPLEFQVILIEEEEELTSQWINEDENFGEKRVSPFTTAIFECGELITTDIQNASVDDTEMHPINFQSFTKNKIKNQKRKRKDNEITKTKCSSLVANNSPEAFTGTRFHFVHKDTIKEIGLHCENVMDTTLENQGQMNDIKTLIAINSRSFEPPRKSSICSSDDLQSVLINQLTLQMINANINILEEDSQMDDFETLLAVVDDQASLASINILDEKCLNPFFENSGNVLKANNEILLGCNNEIPPPDIKINGFTNAASHIGKEAEGFLRKINDKSTNSEYKLTNPTSNSAFNKLPINNAIAENAAVRRLKQINSRSMRCRLCVCKVSEQPLFATKQILDEHIATVHDDKERPYNCPQCTARYRTRSGCVAHINAIHLKKRDKCELCDKIVAGGAGQMRMHIERNHTHGNYTCEICHIELKNISLYNFKYHKRWHNVDKLWRCDLCEKAFVTRTHLIEHKVTHTRQGEFLCTRCGKSTRSKWELRTHLYAIHGEGEAPLKCNYCEEKFTQHVQKRAHIERYHPMELAKRIVPCPKCDKHFSTETNLQRHVQQQHNGPVDNRRSDVVTTLAPLYEGFMCAHCPRKYRSKYALIKHLRVHTVMPDRPYSCPDCEMHFKHFSELDRHDLQHHATVRPFRCNECSKAFATKTALKIHGHVHEVKGRNYRCPECNQRFKFEKSLNLHIISHKTMRHSCEICKKSYIRLTQLKTHKKRYHKRTNDSEED